MGGRGFSLYNLMKTENFSQEKSPQAQKFTVNFSRVRRPDTHQEQGYEPYLEKEENLKIIFEMRQGWDQEFGE